MINSYSFIYNLGHKAITDLLKGPVIVEEKIDGSQFSFSKDMGGKLSFRSKGADIYPEAPDKLFARGVEEITALEAVIGLTPGFTYRGEYLSKPHHNVLTYDRTPHGYVIIFDIDAGDGDYLSPKDKLEEAGRLGLECVPVLFQGMVNDADQLAQLLETTSVLGGQKIEGMVIKPQAYDLFGRDKKVLMGKHVSEAFKETHTKEWKKTPGNKDILTILAAVYCTPARWQKALQHLRDAGQLEDAPQDIGKLMAEVPRDVGQECEAEIRDKLWAWAWPQLRRALGRGLPEWYKNLLMQKQFNGEPDNRLGTDPALPTNSEFESGGVERHAMTTAGLAEPDGLETGTPGLPNVGIRPLDALSGSSAPSALNTFPAPVPSSIKLSEQESCQPDFSRKTI